MRELLRQNKIHEREKKVNKREIPEKKNQRKVGKTRYQHFIPLKEQEGIIGTGIKGSQKG